MRNLYLSSIIASFGLLLPTFSNGNILDSSKEDTSGIGKNLEGDIPNFNPIPIMTFNIRYDNPQDGADRWSNRKEKVAQTIISHQAQVIGIQEALHHQCTELASYLKGYKWIGVGRDDGKDQGEYAPIFYKKKFWRLLDWGTFWLSPTPEKPSKGWDAALPRILTWSKFKHKKSKKTVYIFNTHFDHRGNEARFHSTSLIREKIQQLAGNAPYILTGDFNFTPDKDPYTNLMAPGGGISIMDGKLGSIEPPKGPEGTYSGFRVQSKTPENRIDYIFVHPSIDVLQYEVITTSWNGHYPSDHFPVVCQIDLGK
jgi:endonuclease/exonuclease/phosphatase family metal-dependent hydrolase